MPVDTMTLSIQQNSNHHDDVENHHGSVREEQVHVLMYGTINRPQRVKEHKHKPRRQRDAYTAVRRIDLNDLWQERERCRDSNTVHQVVEVPLRRTRCRERLKPA